MLLLTLRNIVGLILYQDEPFFIVTQEGECFLRFPDFPDFSYQVRTGL